LSTFEEFYFTIFTRSYAGAVLAVIVCPPVCHTPVVPKRLYVDHANNAIPWTSDANNLGELAKSKGLRPTGAPIEVG